MFILEDGTGVTDANAYIDVAYLDLYASNIGYDISGKTTAQKEAIISRVSMNYIDIRYTFSGTLLKTTQGLAVPTDTVTITNNFKRAVADACVLDAQSKLFLVVDTTGKVKRTKTKLDVLEEEIEYEAGTTNTSQYGKTPVTDKLLKPYLSTSGVTVGRWV